jgi:SAM-dependent methyltransferase
LTASNDPMLKRFYLYVMTDDREMETVASFAAKVDQHGRVIDIGCGYGRYLSLLKTRGFDVTGVDINPELVAACRKSGFACFSPAEFAVRDEAYDAMLMTHVIEHFSPSDLLPFIDGYLDRLRVGGHLVIATPLMSNNFYDDFDHVRPYQPLGLLMVFGRGAAQVQYYARNCLELRDIRFRRGPWRLNYSPLRFATDRRRYLMQAIDLACVLLFHVSFGLLGRTDGWVGLFRKIERSA